MRVKLNVVAFVILPLLMTSGHGESEEKAAPIDGVYTMCEEVSGYSGETLELRNGKFRYWFYSDVGGDEATYPIVGTYVRTGDRLRLKHPDVYSNERVLSTVNGHSIIWRDDGLRLWDQEKRIKPYAVLLRTKQDKVMDPWANRPSIKLLHDEEMIRRQEQEYQTRYDDAPEPVRSLLRARSRRDDPGLEEFSSKVRKARENLDARLVRQLVARMGYESGIESIRANSILSKLYESSRLIPEKPAFIAWDKEFSDSLDLLVEAMSEVKDRRALTDSLILFLRVSKIGKMDLAIPEVGIRIRLKAPQGGGHTDSAGRIEGSKIGPKDYKWREEIEVVREACQTWCRQSLDAATKK